MITLMRGCLKGWGVRANQVVVDIMGFGKVGGMVHRYDNRGEKEMGTGSNNICER
jgi:hypothetical protein